MSVSLYRKWRPQTFSEMSAQDHISRTLRGALKTGRVAHAFVFAGPRGTGKTTMARILARAVNCTQPKDGEPCGTCEVCKSFLAGRAIDLVEIDAASNRGIDDIRELRESVRFSPSEASKKVYIIDEAHMLTKEAFNALLKTLEEPPEYAIFILATTEADRLPETILSRCQRFDFRPVQARYLHDRVALIAGKEKIEVEDKAIDLIVNMSGGSFRDAISLLDQLSSAGGKITAASAAQMLGLSDQAVVSGLTQRLLSGDSTGALRELRGFVEGGGDASRLVQQMIGYLRILLLHKLLPGSQSTIYSEQEIAEAAAPYQPRQLAECIEVLRRSSELSIDSLPSLGLELAIVSLGSSHPVVTEPEEATVEVIKPVESPKQVEVAVVEIEVEKAPPAPVAEVAAEPEAVAAPAPAPKTTQKQIELAQIQEAWPQILSSIKPYNHSIAAFLLVCKATDIVGNRLILAFPYKFHRERIAETRNRQVVEKVLEDVLGVRLQVDCVLADQGTLVEQIASTEPADSDNLIDTALEIFGGRVVS